MNALCNDNRLKLGVFGLNVSNGCAATTAEGHLESTWQNNLDIAVMADRHLTTMGLDGVVLNWANYEAALAHWISDVLPVMEQAGMRRPYAPTQGRRAL